MAFTLQTGVVLDAPPIVVDRTAEGGPQRGVARAITGDVIVCEVQQNQTKSELRLLIGCASDAQRLAIEAAIDALGVRSVSTGVETVAAVPADRSLQRFTPIVTPEGFEDADVNLQPLPADLRRWQIELLYYRTPVP